MEEEAADMQQQMAAAGGGAPSGCSGQPQQQYAPHNHQYQQQAPDRTFESVNDMAEIRGLL
eukprot:7353465-Pyramimonas_sp.AAC.1